MRRALLIALLALLGGDGIAGEAQLKKGEDVVLKLPAGLFTTKSSMWHPETVFVATVLPGGPLGAIVNGQEEWQTSGFPLMSNLKVAKVSGGQGACVERLAARSAHAAVIAVAVIARKPVLDMPRPRGQAAAWRRRFG